MPQGVNCNPEVVSLTSNGQAKAMHSGKFTSPPIPLNLGSKKDGFDRADIEIFGIDQSGASFEGRVFLNNPDANFSTPLSPEHGYAGSFHVYGYGIWPAD